jgi:hypothetical protein
MNHTINNSAETSEAEAESVLEIGGGHEPRHAIMPTTTTPTGPIPGVDGNGDSVIELLDDDSNEPIEVTNPLLDLLLSRKTEVGNIVDRSNLVLGLIDACGAKQLFGKEFCESGSISAIPAWRYACSSRWHAHSYENWS